MENIYKLSSIKSNIKIALVFFSQSGTKADYPLSLGIIAGILRDNNIDTTIIVDNIETYNANLFNSYDLVAIYPMASNIHKILDLIKKNTFNKRYKTLLFNSDQYQHEMILCAPKSLDYAKSLMEECKNIDYILLGECEYSFLKLVEILNLNIPYDNIPMFLYRNQNSIIYTGQNSVPIEIDSLPRISRDFLDIEIVDNCNTFSAKIMSSRGCPSGCLYCSEASVNIIDDGRKNVVIKSSIDKFIGEIKYLQEKYKVVFFNIIDSSFEISGKSGLDRIKYFCKQIIEEGIIASFKIHLRVGTLGKLDNDFLKLLKQAGIDIIITGVESGVERELLFYTKKTSLLKNENNIEYIDDFNQFFVLLGHMMFSPFLRIEDLYSKIDYLKKINRCWDFLNISNNLIVYRGTKLHDLIIKLNLNLETSDTSATIPYKYEEEDVKYIADIIGNLKIKSNIFMNTNKLIYDSLNLKSRYYNKLNIEFHSYNQLFQNFFNDLENTQNNLSLIYYNYFTDTLNSIASIKSSNLQEFNSLELIKNVEDEYNHLHLKLEELLNTLENKNLNFNKLYLKTWLSPINNSNTSGGKV